jgi:hypothetical protein
VFFFIPFLSPFVFSKPGKRRRSNLRHRPLFR